MGRNLKVTVDHAVCVGNGTCIRTATHVFRHNDARQSVVVDPAADPPAEVLEAAESCPVSAIRVEDADTGEVLFP
jgi:ferredoxin